MSGDRTFSTLELATWLAQQFCDRAEKAEARVAELQREMESRELHHLRRLDQAKRQAADEAVRRRLTIDAGMVSRAAAAIFEAGGACSCGIHEPGYYHECRVARAALRAALEQETTDDA